MTSLAVKDLVSVGEFIARELPTKLLCRGRTYEDFPDDEVPLCTSCDKVCEWIYFSPTSNKAEDAVVTWCGWCAQARIEDGGKSWKVYVRAGLHEHLRAVKRLKSQGTPVVNQRLHPPAGTQQAGVAAKASPQQPEAETRGKHPAAETALPPSSSAAKHTPQSPPRAAAPKREHVPASAVNWNQQQQQQQEAAPTNGSNPRLWTGAKGTFYQNMKMILRQYFVTGEGSEYRTSGAEIVRQYKKHWKNYNPQWKLVYEVVSSCGFQCTQETVVSMQGKTKQVTRVVRGLKLK